ncbi:transmembrane protein 170A-like [Glossina fuscipes]|uniref:Transmembrane protein 170A-like n=1 Tax=Glossina fuscipes TaxID=7396 RepID=A0A9C6DQP0_9MUSC|nr:transmembrane protein 170A-like [Glossina fuscipes]
MRPSIVMPLLLFASFSLCLFPFIPFLWALFSSIFIHTCAALVAFVTLRKHKFGRFFSILILVMGFLSPAVSGIISSAVIAFVHRASSLPMSPIIAMIWGMGQTIVSACLGFTRNSL